MGSSLEALISRDRALLEPIAADIGSQCCDLPQGFVLVPIPEEVMPDDWEDAYDDFTYCPPEIAERARAAAGQEGVAYVENSTGGGEGTQRAVVWRAGAVAWGPKHTCHLEMDAKSGELEWAADPRDAAINAVLREIGVDRGSEFDEFWVLGLHLKRRTEEWLE